MYEAEREILLDQADLLQDECRRIVAGNSGISNVNNLVQLSHCIVEIVRCLSGEPETMKPDGNQMADQVAEAVESPVDGMQS